MLFFKRKVWKEIKRVNIGSFINYGSSPQEISTMYRIAIYEKCLVTNQTRIREISDFFPCKE